MCVDWTLRGETNDRELFRCDNNLLNVSKEQGLKVLEFLRIAAGAWHRVSDLNITERSVEVMLITLSPKDIYAESGEPRQTWRTHWVEGQNSGYFCRGRRKCRFRKHSRIVIRGLNTHIRLLMNWQVLRCEQFTGGLSGMNEMARTTRT